MRVELGLVGVVLAALAGFLVGTLIEHPPGPGGLQFIGALIGATVALAALMLGESLKYQSLPEFSLECRKKEQSLKLTS